MATRHKLFRGTGIPTTDTIVNGADGEVNLQPPANIKWTVVELRPGLSAAGEWRIKFDTEKYYNGRQELDFLAKGAPIVVAIDIVQPHFLEYHALADASTLTATFETTLEESALTA